MIRQTICVLLLVVGGLPSVCAAKSSVTDPEVAALAAPLATGVTEIRDKALDPPEVDQLFAAALTSLSVLDSTLHVEVSDDTLIVRRGEKIVARTGRPHRENVGEWVADIQTLIAATRAASPPLANASSESLLRALFNGFMPLLDHYSRYAGRDDAARNRNTRNGSGGLGFELQQGPSGAVVLSVLKDGPADRAGLIPNDIVTQLDDVHLAGVPLPTVLRRVNGDEGTVATMTVSRDGMFHTFAVRRELIIPETVTAETNDGVLHLTVKSFNVRTAAAISDAVSAAGPLHGLILDLRNDPGGLLDQAIAIADLFLDSGVIANLHGRYPAANQSYAATAGDIAHDVPIAVLVDGLSASSAEILATALQENGRAIVVGTATVGKGTVQTVIELPNDGELVLTWARVFTPNGTLLNERGVLPDICTSSPAIGPPPGADEIVATALRARTNTASPPPDVQAARNACRPEPRQTQPVDLDVARRWLADPSLRTALAPPARPQLSATH